MDKLVTRFVASLTLIVLAQSAYGILGTYLPSSELPPNVCQITYELTNSLCTGFIVGNRAIITAGHCEFEKTHSPTTVSCPNGETRNVKMRFSLSTAPKDFGNDVALLFVDEDFSATPFALPMSKLETEALVKRGDCSLYGYGLDNNRRSGVYHGRTAPFVLNYDRQIVPITQIDPSLEFIGLHRSLDRGDSGGPLVCKNEVGLAFAVSNNTFAVFDDDDRAKAAFLLPLYRHKKWLDDLLKLDEEGLKARYDKIKLSDESIAAMRIATAIESYNKWTWKSAGFTVICDTTLSQYECAFNIDRFSDIFSKHYRKNKSLFNNQKLFEQIVLADTNTTASAGQIVLYTSDSDVEMENRFLTSYEEALRASPREPILPDALEVKKVAIENATGIKIDCIADLPREQCAEGIDTLSTIDIDSLLQLDVQIIFFYHDNWINDAKRGWVNLDYHSTGYEMLQFLKSFSFEKKSKKTKQKRRTAK